MRRPSVCVTNCHVLAQSWTRDVDLRSRPSPRTADLKGEGPLEPPNVLRGAPLALTRHGPVSHIPRTSVGRDRMNGGGGKVSLSPRPAQSRGLEQVPSFLTSFLLPSEKGFPLESCPLPSLRPSLPLRPDTGRPQTYHPLLRQTRVRRSEHRDTERGSALAEERTRVRVRRDQKNNIVGSDFLVYLFSGRGRHREEYPWETRERDVSPLSSGLKVIKFLVCHVGYRTGRRRSNHYFEVGFPSLTSDTGRDTSCDPSLVLFGPGSLVPRILEQPLCFTKTLSIIPCHLGYVKGPCPIFPLPSIFLPVICDRDTSPTSGRVLPTRPKPPTHHTVPRSDSVQRPGTDRGTSSSVPEREWESDKT